MKNRIVLKILNFINPAHIKKMSIIRQNDRRELNTWIKTGLKVPPPDIVKWNIINKYRRKENIKAIIGSGIFFNNRKPLLKEKFVRVLDFPILFNIDEQTNQVDFDQFEKILDKNKQKLILWIDYKTLLNNKDIVDSEHIIKNIIKIAFKVDFNHTILFDDSLSYYEHENLPSVHEIKQWFIKTGKSYENIKTENNIFIFSPKL